MRRENAFQKVKCNFLNSYQDFSFTLSTHSAANICGCILLQDWKISLDDLCSSQFIFIEYTQIF